MNPRPPNDKQHQHQRPRNSGRRDAARNRHFPSDDAQAARQRDQLRRDRRRQEKAQRERDSRFAARLAEVPALALDAYQTYRAEVERRRAAGKPTLLKRDEYKPISRSA